MVEWTSGDPLDEDGWSLSARASAAVGLASRLTLPVLRAERVIGTLNLYVASTDACTGHHQLAVALAASAEHAVRNADLSFSTRLAAAEAPK